MKRIRIRPIRFLHSVVLLSFCDPLDLRAQGVGIDATSSADTGSSNQSSLTWSHTTAGSNRLLVVGVSINNENSGTVTSVTYGGTSLTLLDTATNGTSARVEIWYLKAPATGANDIVVTLSQDQRFVGGATSFTGVHQTTPLGTFASATGTSLSASVTVTSGAGELVVDAVAKKNSDSTLTVDTGQTQRWNDVTTNSTTSNNVVGAASTEQGVGSVTMSWTISGASSRAWAIGGVSVKPAASDQMRLITGSYTGNASDGRSISGLGFQPDVVIIKGENTQAMLRTSSMPSDNAKYLDGATALTSNLIESLDPNGFTIGSHADVNGSGVTYYWTAFKAASGEMKVSSYSGTTSSQGITGVGFQPEIVVVLGASTTLAVHRTATMSTTFSFNDGGAADRITSLDADGFTVGTDVNVNFNGVTYHYIAWNTVAGRIREGSYTGNESDNRSITGVGFLPELVIVKPGQAGRATHKIGAMGLTADLCSRFQSVGWYTNRIQKLESDGFQLGSNVDVNASSVTFYFVAFARTSPTAVTLQSFDAIDLGGDMLLRWRTGIEFDNLGFHIWREDAGERLRLTPDLIAGSALLDGSGTGTVGGGSYAWWDLEGTTGSRYWLEAVDLNGRCVFHGPAAPQPRGDSPICAPSPLLAGRGRPAGEDIPAIRQRIRAAPRLASVSKSISPAPEGEPAEASPDACAEPQGEARERVETQWSLAACGAVKILVREDGWYRIGQPLLAAAGLDPKAHPRLLRLFAGGREEQLLVTGGSDGRFEPEDAIEFYGTRCDTPWTDARAYWLVCGSRPGRRIPSVTYRGPGKESPSSYPCSVERKDRTIYFAALKNGEAENFFGAAVTAEPLVLVLSLPSVAPSPPGDALLEVSVQGVTGAPHLVAVSWNDVEVAEIAFDGMSRGAMAVSIPHTNLLDGENVVTLAARGDKMDVSAVEKVRITYFRAYEADRDALRFTAEGGTWLTVRGFSSPAIRVVDLTDVARIWLVRGAAVPDGDGFAVRFKVPRSGPRTLFAFAPARILTPAAVEADAPSAWHDEENGADLVILGPRDLLEALSPLAAWHEARGLRVATVDIADAYDEFSFGEKDPAAIRRLLCRARHRWAVAPRFLLLAGDASFDPRDRLGLGALDLVPTKLIDTDFIETACDDWFADFDGDGVPEMAVGRLPARSAGDAKAMAQRIVAHALDPGGPWMREALLIAGWDDRFDFEAASRMVASELPQAWTIRELRLGTGDAGPADLIEAIDQGTSLVSYMGHGSVERWQGDGLTSREARDLRNGSRLPLVLCMTCLNGFFHDPHTECLAEALLAGADGGALAVWASSGLTRPDGQAVLDQELVRLLMAEPGLTVGEAAARAKRAVADGDIRRTWILFGDPAVCLR